MSSLSIREIEILKMLSKDEIILSSEMISKRLNVSSRTVKNDVKNLMSIGIQNGFRLTAIHGKGYRLKIVDFHLYQQLLEYVYSVKEFDSQNSRVHYISRRLLLNKGFLTSEKLADEMFLSISSLRKDLKSVQKLLQEDDLFLISVPNKGLKVEGKEVNIRKAISKYIDIDILSIESYNQFFGTQILDYRKIKVLTDEFINIFRDYNNYFLGISITNILIHIIIAINRITAGNKIDLKGDIVRKSNREYEIALRLSKTIEQELNVKLSEDEVDYLAYCLIGKGLYKYDNIIVKRFILDVYDRINEIFSLELKQHEDYSRNLYYHTMALIDRLKYNITITSGENLSNLKSNFVFEYELALIYKQEFANKFHFNLEEIEVNYIALHFGAVLENIRLERTMPKMILVTDVRPSQALMMKNEIVSYFKSNINVVGIYSPYEIKNVDLKSVNYVVSTVKIPFVNTEKYLLISSDLMKTDFDLIDNFVGNEVRFTRIFKRDLFISDLKSNDYLDALIEIGKLYTQRKYVSNFDDFLSNTVNREKLQSTRAGYILAFPHSLHPVAVKSFIAISISKKGINWIDGGLVKIILYVGLREDEKKDFEYVLRILSKITRDKNLMDKLAKAISYDQFIQILSEKIVSD